MAKTIIQSIGPLYGEVANGTVFGRPNGSIYVPATNVIRLTGTAKIKNFTVGTTKRVRFVDDSDNYVLYSVVAESQDLASNIQIVIASDAELTTVLASQSFGAGLFNRTPTNIVNNYELTAETTYYIGAILMNNGTAVAVDVVEVVAV